MSRFVLKLIVNNKKKDATVVRDKAHGHQEAEKIEGERLFWIGNKAYGKVNSYRLVPEEVR